MAVSIHKVQADGRDLAIGSRNRSGSSGIRIHRRVPWKILSLEFM